MIECNQFRFLIVSIFLDEKLDCAKINSIRTHYRSCAICYSWLNGKIRFLSLYGFCFQVTKEIEK